MTAQKFTFEHDGKTFSIPLFKDIPTGALRKSRNAADDMDRAFIIIEQVVGEDSPQLKALDSMSIDQFGKFLEDWTQGAGVGEAVSSES